MRGILKFNEDKLRYYLDYGGSMIDESTSGNRIKIYYNDLVFNARIEHNSQDYYMVEYKKIDLKSLLSLEAEVG